MSCVKGGGASNENKFGSDLGVQGRRSVVTLTIETGLAEAESTEIE